jgi:hypothetical protein
MDCSTASGQDWTAGSHRPPAALSRDEMMKKNMATSNATKMTIPNLSQAFIAFSHVCAHARVRGGFQIPAVEAGNYCRI